MTMSTINNNTTLSASTPAAEATHKIHKYLIFMIRDTETTYSKLGVDAEYVLEILNNYNLTYLPLMPDYVSGVFNMRGQIIPVMDLRLRLGKPATEKGLVVVLNYNGMQLGILVDAVDRMIDIDDGTITTVHSQEAQRFASGMCSIPDNSGTLIVLDCAQLFAHE